MTNDAKLGLVAGVAGVVVAAVLSYQNQPSPQAAPPAPTAAATAEATAGVSAEAGTNSSPVVGQRGKPAAGTPVSSRVRKEPQGTAVSRTADDEDD
jgi:hypothetical protein